MPTSAPVDAIEIDLPFTGRWRAQNSPARRVPSHGSSLFGEDYAIDFVAVDARGRTAQHRDWRTAFGSEPPERYYAFGRELLAPIDGTVVAIHDQQPDHEGRRSQLTLLPYVLGQAKRLRQGLGAIAGNYVIIELRQPHRYLAMAHIRKGSFRVAAGDKIAVGDAIAECGNSGNSTEPHVHLQLMDSADFSVARGVPMAFRRFREWSRNGQSSTSNERGMPAEGSSIEALGVRR